MVKPKLFRAVLLSPLLLAAWIPSANAYQNYSTNGTTGNCASCHGAFDGGTYTSLVDGANWGDNLHNVHRTTMLGGDCDVCHSSGGRTPVSLSSSVGGTGLDPISCLGCHGRSEGGTVTGAGLRQHHYRNGVTTCGTAGCHADANPSGFTTVGEDILPPYYATPDAAHPNKPTDPCNPNGEEDFVGTLIGLDNDGDNLFDLNDSDCQVVVPAPDINLSPFALNFGAVPAGSSVTLNTEIQNLGTLNLNISLINLCAGTSTEFTWAPVAPFAVAPGMSQTLAVTYAPVDDGIDTGCLAISSNDPDEATRQLGLNNTSSILRFIPAFIHPAKTGTQ